MSERITEGAEFSTTGIAGWYSERATEEEREEESKSKEEGSEGKTEAWTGEGECNARVQWASRGDGEVRTKLCWVMDEEVEDEDNAEEVTMAAR